MPSPCPESPIVIVNPIGAGNAAHGLAGFIEKYANTGRLHPSDVRGASDKVHLASVTLHLINPNASLSADQADLVCQLISETAERLDIQEYIRKVDSSSETIAGFINSCKGGNVTGAAVGDVKQLLTEHAAGITELDTRFNVELKSLYERVAATINPNCSLNDAQRGGIFGRACSWVLNPQKQKTTLLEYAAVLAKIINNVNA